MIRHDQPSGTFLRLAMYHSSCPGQMHCSGNARPFIPVGVRQNVKGVHTVTSLKSIFFGTRRSNVQLDTKLATVLVPVKECRLKFAA